MGNIIMPSPAYFLKLIETLCFWSTASIDFFALQTIRNLVKVFESLAGFMERMNDFDLANVCIPD